MIKNATFFRINSANIADSLSTLADAMDSHTFAPCGATQEKSMGWVSPRGDGELIAVVAGQWVLKLATETKKVPAQALKDKVDEQCKAIEAQTGRKPGKKERRELTEDAHLSLLPMAFSKRTTTTMFIDPAARLLLVDATTQGRVDDATMLLVRCFDGIALQLVNTQTSPAAGMAHWLREREAPADFSVDRECELKACDESKAVVKYGRHALDTDEVVQHIEQGKLPTKLAMTWRDRVSFVLTEGLQLKKLDFLESVFDGAADEKADRFDADIAITTGELSAMFGDLVFALGGELQAAN